MSSSNTISQYDKMTKTPIPKLLIALSIPTTISMLVTNIYNMADTAFVGQLGTSASGAIGVVFGFMAIIQAFGFMFGMGCGSIISRSLGEKDVKNASLYASTGFFSAFLFGVLIEILGFLFLDPLVVFLGSTKTIEPFAKTYISYILVAAPFMASSYTLNNVLRYEGKAVLGMVGLMTGAILNMVGDPIFMFGFHMGIHGAGLSTCLSQIVSFLILLSMFFRKKTLTQISLNRVARSFGVYVQIVTTGLPSLIRQFLNTFATVLLNHCAGMYGDAAVAAMSIVSRISFFVFSVSLGIGQGYQPISGFNYGAKKYDRVREGFKTAILFSQIVLVLFAAVVMIFSEPIVTVFRDDPEVIQIAIRALRLQCLALLLMPFMTITEMQMQSTGKKLAASILSSLKSGIFFIPTLLLLAKFRGIAGIQEAQPLANVFSLFPSIFFAIWFFRNLPKESR